MVEAVEQAQWIALDTLKLWTRNYNQGDIGAISNSIKRFGFNKSVRAWNGVVMAGNHSIKALRQLQVDGWQPSGGGLRVIDGDWYVSVIDVSHLSEQEAEAFAIADNRTAELASHDDVALAELLQEMALADMALMRDAGYDGDDLDMLLAELGAAYDDPTPDPGGQIDRAAELQVKWQTERGQVWQVGAHRIMCGDSTDAGDVARLMGGTFASLVITDPPYGVEYADKNKFLNAISRGNRIQTPIAGDHGTKADIQEMWKAAFGRMNEVMCPGAVVYCFMPQGGDQMMMMMMMMGAGIEPRHELIWLKNNHVLGRVDYAYKHEPILYAWKDGGHKFYGDFQTSIIECDKPQSSKLHPTMKPVELITKLIVNSSRRGEAVYDPFLGSGTTLVACEQTGRVGYGMEIDAAYVAVALERLTGMGLEAELSD